MIQLDQLLTSKQVAEAWGVREQHINKLRRRGELTAIGIGGAYRYDPKDLQKYLERQKGKN
ncbi:AlpA family transcriptional regulator [Brevibacterium sanguinis]|uniref:AlpA family transcriptional regulator n=2 Tax=Brevibacterium TaxID=1696 RepID=A0A366IKR8_9MICO|nr:MULTISPECIES: helix-turn-helix domain-containing protein [Brevibacterium]RBP66376.1 AlpA family transcriptional regulator [Brevibacterium sanguinis]RBP73027.1 AlpA family transcriptional regulator [Brevibacterium celere]